MLVVPSTSASAPDSGVRLRRASSGGQTPVAGMATAPTTNARRASVSGGDEQRRTPLACLKCRTKRIRCDGARPCQPCQRYNTVCQFPEGRRKKRTKKEIEEADEQERVEREKQQEVSKNDDAMTNKPAPILQEDATLAATNPSIPPYAIGAPSMDIEMPYKHQSHPSSMFLTEAVGGTSNGLGLHNYHSPYGVNNAPPIYSDHRPHTGSAGHGDTFNAPPLPTADLNNWLGLPTTTNNESTFNPLVDSSNSSFRPFADGDSGSSGATSGSSQAAQLPTQPGMGSGSVLPDLVANGGLAILQGDSSRQNEPLELYYYQFTGQTSFSPGINRINLKLQPKPHPDDEVLLPGAAPAPIPSALTSPLSTGSSTLHRNPSFAYFDDHGLPLPHISGPLMDIFLRECGQYWPSMWPTRLRERQETGTMSSFCMNAICAVAARFDPAHQAAPLAACAPFITKAQELLVPLLHLPSHPVAVGLLMLAWASYGQGSESGLWQYSGMSIRMAFDLGTHEASDIYESDGNVVRTNTLLWQIYLTDRMTSFTAGRPATISDESIEVPLPTDADMRMNPDIVDQEHFAFPQLVRLSVILGKISNTLNGRCGRPRTLVDASDEDTTALLNLQRELVSFYRLLPHSLHWFADNFKRHEAGHQGGIFLQLHLWAHAVLALTYHPDLASSPAGEESAVHQSMYRSTKLSLISARLINESLVFADFCTSQCYISGPFVVQPIFVAALAFLHEVRNNGQVQQQSHDQPAPTTTVAARLAQITSPGAAFLASLDRQNFATLLRALYKIEHYWAGAAQATRVLRERETGLGLLDDSWQSQAGAFAAISLPDKGLVRRYETTDPNVTPATTTSLRDSRAGSQIWFDTARTGDPGQAANLTTCSFSDLWSNYSIGDATISPSNYLEISRLLGGDNDASRSAVDFSSDTGMQCQQ